MALPAVSAEHARKRQYQPSIDSFFQRNGSSTGAGPGSGPSSRITSPMSPPLPAETQSSLLSVGMRVRKSVPEGYKTHKTMPGEEFPFPSTAPATAAPVRPTYSTTNSRELAPFCGLHKIGGFSAQDSFAAPPSSAPPAFPTGDEAPISMPGLSISQNTVSSTQGSVLSQPSTTTNKRSYDEEVENDLDEYFAEIEAEEQRPPPVARRIAKMKGSPRKQALGLSSGVVSTGGPEGDFEEASFLVPMETDA